MRSLIHLRLQDLLHLAIRYDLLDDYLILDKDAPAPRVWVRQWNFARVLEEQEAILFLAGLIRGYLRASRTGGVSTPGAFHRQVEAGNGGAGRGGASPPHKPYVVTRIV